MGTLQDVRIFEPHYLDHFIIDFLLKFFLTPNKIHFLKTNWLTAISLVIPALRVFRLLRILRLLKGVRLIKIVASLNRSIKSQSATMKRRGFACVVLLTLLVTFGGAAGMYAIEKETRALKIVAWHCGGPLCG